MKTKERFYYGENLSKSNLEVLVDDNDNIVASGRLMGRSSFPRIAICGVYDYDNHTLSFGVARCSHNDVFVKSVGRELSKKRAFENPCRVVTVGPNEKISEVFEDNVADIEEQIMSMRYPIDFSKISNA